MRLPFIFVIAYLLSSTANSETLVTKTVLDGKVSLLTPDSFSVMSKENLDHKYPSPNKPTVVLSNEAGTVNLAFNHTQNPLSPGEVKEAHSVFSEMFHNMYPSAKWVRDEVINKGKSSFIVMELITPAADTEIHNIMYGTSVDDRFLLVAFNTTSDESDEWLAIGKKMMESLKINYQ